MYYYHDSNTILILTETLILMRNKMKLTTEKREEVKKYLKQTNENAQRNRAEFSFRAKNQPCDVIREIDSFIERAAWSWVSEYILSIMDNTDYEIIEDLNRIIEAEKEDKKSEEEWCLDGKSATDKNQVLFHEYSIKAIEFFKEMLYENDHNN